MARLTIVPGKKPVLRLNRCANCYYFYSKPPQRGGPLVVGHCHRFPPQVIYDFTENATDNKFPMVRVTDWCGEHDPLGPGDDISLDNHI